MLQTCSPAEYLPEVVRLSRHRFAAAAFGPDPAGDTAALARPATVGESWLAAVALGGQGRFAAARAELAGLAARFGGSGSLDRGPAPDRLLGALTLATQASLWRQLGWHERAAAHDGRALALALAVPQTVPGQREAVCEVLTGLAADALGTAGPATALRLLKRCEVLLDDLGGPWRRERLRWHWVRAETALATAGGGAVAAHHADAAVAIAARGPSQRHRVKSDLLKAATVAVTDAARARALSASVARAAAEHGLLPLRWACALLRGSFTVSPEQDEASVLAQVLLQRGGLLRSATAVLGKL